MADIEQKSPRGCFYWRRWLRLFPALIVVCTTLLIVSIHFASFSQSVTDVATSVSYIANWTRAFGSGAPSYLGNTWSLAVEEQFYVLWPIIFNLSFNRGNLKTLLISALSLCLLSIAWRIFLLLNGASFDRLYNGFDSHCDGLLIGCVLAALPDNPLAAQFKRLTASASPLAVIILMFVVSTYGWTIVTAVPINLAAGSLILAAIHLPESVLSRILSHSLLVYIGKISYGLYLWHYPIQIVLLNQFVPPLVRGLIDFPLSFLLAAASYRFVERPALKFRYSISQHVSQKLGWTAFSITLIAMIGGMTIFYYDDIRQAINPQPIFIEAYGPHLLKRGEVFNLQPSGKSVMWARLSHSLRQDARVMIDGEIAEAQISDRTVAIILSEKLRSIPGKKTISIVSPAGDALVPPIIVEIENTED